MTNITTAPVFRKPDISEFEMPGSRELQERHSKMMMEAFNEVLRQVVESCLGRPFHPDDSPRFVLGIPPSDPSARIVMFDGVHVCTISGVFVVEDGAHLYRVSANPPNHDEAQSQ